VLGYFQFQPVDFCSEFLDYFGLFGITFAKELIIPKQSLDLGTQLRPIPRIVFSQVSHLFSPVT